MAKQSQRHPQLLRAITVRVRFTGTAARYRQEKQMHPSQEIVSKAKGVTEVTYQLTSTFEIKSWILSFGSSAEVLSPASLRTEIVHDLKAATDIYERSSAIGEHA